MTIFGSGIWLPLWISEYILAFSVSQWTVLASAGLYYGVVIISAGDMYGMCTWPLPSATVSCMFQKVYCGLHHCPGVLCVCGCWTPAANVCWRVSLSHPPPPPASFLPHGCNDSWGTYIIVSCNALTFHAWWSPWWESCTGLLRSWFCRHVHTLQRACQLIALVNLHSILQWEPPNCDCRSAILYFASSHAVDCHHHTYVCWHKLLWQAPFVLHTYVWLLVLLKLSVQYGNIVCCLSAVEYEYELISI